MFDGPLPEIADLASLTDAELVDAVVGWARVENAAGARKLAVMAEVFARRTGPADKAERELWWLDPDAAVAAELAAALNVTSGLALHQTNRGLALRDRLPAVGRLYEQGLISDVLVRVIVSRTYLIDDPDALAAVDTELAERVMRWGALSQKKTIIAIDALVEAHDPGALRRTQQANGEETVQFGAPTDVPGMMTIFARVNAADGALMEQNVTEIADSVCDADPRTADHRRARALVAAVNHTAFDCGCDDPDCPGGTPGDAPAKNAVVYAIPDNDTNDAAQHGSHPDDPDTPEPAGCAARPAYVFGAGIMPTALLAGILARATVREVRHPGADSLPEPRYTPSKAVCEFVRCRDLTCRFPGCDKPAEVCDIDHTVAYPVGPTHPSNLKCLCRFHHLLKTFWNGAGGWRDRQLPDGTVVWTSPTGHTYVTYPGSLHLFPRLCLPTAALWDGEPPVVDTSGDRGMKMPKRRRTRAQNCAKAKAAERRLNDALVAEHNKPPPF